jgi:sulfide dehydrogenase cytochrome subunit
MNTRPGISVVLWCACAGALGAAAGWAAGDDYLAAGCAGCHGQRGEGHGAFPPLAGQPPAALLQSLRDFKSDRRSATVMPRIAKGYSDAELVRLARYFANRP